MEPDNKRKKARLWTSPIFWGGVASLVIVGGMIALGIMDVCTGGGGADCQPKWKYLLSATPNEIGDTLAGFAGALAFVWIIVTVWLQGKELAAQREELQLTRAEMEEQRKAAQDMARSMAAQAKIFEDEQRFREEGRAKALLEQLLHALDAQLKIAAKITWFYRGKKEVLKRQIQFGESSTRRQRREYKEAELSISLLRYSSKRTPEENMLFISDSIDQTLQFVTELHVDAVLERPEKTEAERLALTLRDIVGLTERLSEDQELRVRYLGLFPMHEAIEKFLEAAIWRDSDDEQEAPL